MAYYMTNGEFQAHMKDYYQRTGNRLQFPEMTEYLYNKGLLYDSIPAPDLTDDYDSMSDEEFEKVVDSLPLSLTLYDGAPLAPTVEEADLIPNARDVFVIRHPRYTRLNLHRHNYFEINYVFRGKGTFILKKKNISCKMVNYVLLLRILNTIFTLMMILQFLQSVYERALSRQLFLTDVQKRSVILLFPYHSAGDGHANYLIFFTNSNRTLKKYIRNMMIECSKRICTVTPVVSAMFT